MRRQLGRTLLGLILLAAPARSVAGFKVTANTVPGGLDGVRVVAISPGVCPPGFDCVWLEDKLVQEMVHWSRFQGVGASNVRQAKLELGAESITPENRQEIARMLGVDAFLVPMIDHSSRESTGGTAYWSGDVLWMSNTKITKGSVELVLVRASDGKAVMKGSGYGESGWRSGKSVVLKSFREILERGFGPPDR